MSLDKFLDKDNNDYRIQVIAPTHTYGTMNSFESRFDFEIDFDEYDENSDWEFNIIINNTIIASFDSLTDTKRFIETINLK